jgi:hypothetical protein
LAGGSEVTINGAKVEVTGNSIDIHSPGLVDVKGLPIKLNC